MINRTMLPTIQIRQFKKYSLDFQADWHKACR
jgi:hypothetical protein